MDVTQYPGQPAKAAWAEEIDRAIDNVKRPACDKQFRGSGTGLPGEGKDIQHQGGLRRCGGTAARRGGMAIGEQQMPRVACLVCGSEAVFPEGPWTGLRSNETAAQRHVKC